LTAGAREPSRLPACLVLVAAVSEMIDAGDDELSMSCAPQLQYLHGRYNSHCRESYTVCSLHLTDTGRRGTVQLRYAVESMKCPLPTL